MTRASPLVASAARENQGTRVTQGNSAVGTVTKYPECQRFFFFIKPCGRVRSSPLPLPPPSPGRKGLRDTNLVPRAFPLKNGWGKALGARLARYLFLELSDWYQIFSGAPNDGFLLNSLKTLFKAIQRTFRSIEMHSKRRYKICICSVILGQLESF